MQISSDDVVVAIEYVLRCGSHANSDGVRIFDFPGIELEPIDETTLNSLSAQISSYEEIDGSGVFTKASYEVLIQDERRPVLLPLRNGIVIDDEHSGLEYTLGRPSDAYSVYLALKLIEASGGKPLRTHISSIARDRIAREEGSVTAFDLMRVSLRERTLRIESNTPRKKSEWANYANAFFFHLAYNLDVSLMPQRSIDELIRPLRISGTRRSRPNDLDAPRRHYVPDLVYHYQLGVSAESPMLAYLSYYHVAEHWFENVYSDDLVEQIQAAITAPSFSYRRKRDIQDLVRKVSRAVQLRDESTVINEQVALRLTLAKYVNVADLVSDIRSFDSSLLDYYATEPVRFCGGERVLLTQPNESDIFAALSKRVYKTRNALVHSKDGSKGRFIPFTHDKELLPEVSLMRFMAEQIITATSSLPAES
ncbi:hypothetical protein [Microbispora sp. H10670]|uniref:hypothetical protein n=1 Tax=Microbispora sp. H10670 TaxID=2729108 RepID=UPI00160262D2|nr:hypothetical protein [Microbispora sp. H10670]